MRGILFFLFLGILKAQEPFLTTDQGCQLIFPHPVQKVLSLNHKGNCIGGKASGWSQLSGKIQYQNREYSFEFEGLFLKGKATQICKLNLKNLFTHHGRFDGWATSEGLRHYLLEGLTLQGYFTHGYLNGSGIMDNALGDHYEGQFLQDIMQGQGTLSYANGDIYRGQFQNGLSQGSGQLIKKSGDVLTGQFFEGLPHGNVHFQTASLAEMYTGEMKRGYRNGQGRLETINSSCLGQFLDHLLHGQASCSGADGEIRGLFKEGRLTQGSRQFPYGIRLEGKFNGLDQGEGELVLPSGKRISGSWNGSFFQTRTGDSIELTPTGIEKFHQPKAPF